MQRAHGLELRALDSARATVPQCVVRGVKRMVGSGIRLHCASELCKQSLRRICRALAEVPPSRRGSRLRATAIAAEEVDATPVRPDRVLFIGSTFRGGTSGTVACS